ncbi:hypothetical protein Dda_1014 [Drechslerella dactyloides]|uniref:Nucleosome assembly protein n=1 Tax=Drechslerella dactyloides TaxID=74499 RepID=A0AAD6J690_DREDA|nr:hypothetical protein Dda_1014 [Drechslerella dactyloides]
MSEPIRNKKLDALAAAPTPQNTPLNNAPISSHAVKPQVSSIEEEDRVLAAGMLAQNPALISMIQGRLGKLVGRTSGYIESLPPVIRRRITGLKGVQKEHSKLEADFQEEVLQLEKKYFAKFKPLYEKRRKIVNGVEEPSEEDVTAGTAEGDDADEGAKMDEDTTPENQEVEAGIPEFWLSAMKNSTSLAETVTDRDEGALKHLVDIRMEYLERPGFRLIFEFAENEFFTNKTLVKTYFYQEENGYGGDFIYDHAEGDKIDWKPGKDLTVRIESKKQRNKNTKQTRIVKRTVPVESFFNFFTPPKPPTSEDGSQAEDEELEQRLELDYTLGEDIKEKLIPRAVDWYTGEALQFEELEELEEGEFDDEDDDDEEASDDDRDEDDEDSEEEDESGKPKQQEAAECKQS